MTLRFLIILTLALLPALWGCGGRSAAEDSLAAVTEAIEAGDMDAAQTRADAIVADSAAYDALSAGQLCILARAFVRLNDTADDTNDALAAQCLTRARRLDPDTVAAFLHSLTGDDAGRLMVLDRVGTYLGVPRDSLVGIEDLDSIQTDCHGR